MRYLMLGWVIWVLGWVTAAAELLPEFKAALPVWPAGREKEKNLTIGFSAAFPAPIRGPVILRVAASTVYRGFVNGEFAGHGPARAGQGYFRVDEWDVTGWIRPGTNRVALEVAGYNVNSYDHLDQLSFLQAELVADGRVLAATGDRGQGFLARTVPERVQKVQRYSFQRPFSEVWRLRPGWETWRSDENAGGTTVALAVQPPKALLPRRVPYPAFAVRGPVRQVNGGTMERGAMPQEPWRDRSLTGIGPKLGGYLESELEVVPSLELQAWRTATVTADGLAAESKGPLGAGAYRIVDLGVNLTGFLGVEVEATSRTRLFLTFDEILRDGPRPGGEGDVDWKRLGCVNVVALDLEPGKTTFESFEPYTLRYCKLIVLEGQATVNRLWLRELANPDVERAHFAASDRRLNRLFEAGRETFRQNAVDVFMDCPSRERAGWLCDSFFTARVATRLSGNAVIERNFLENFALPARFDGLPKGMLPMCYPADHPDGVFIPNWALWFVVQLEEYLARSGDRELIDRLRPRVMGLLDSLESFRNPDGLLEKLPGWVFVEWSKANDWVQDVNYPSNMLFAKALEVAGRLYGSPERVVDAQRVRETIRKQSFDGRFFVDNAVRRDGGLVRTENRSEVCQYFAFYFDVVTPASHPALWQTLRDAFGPERRKTKGYPEVAMANAFVGNVLRLEILSREGRTGQILEESVGYQLYMAERTGTLWENDGDYASCNHGFASHVVQVLYRDVLGLAAVDTVGKVIRLRFGDSGLDWCEGAVPVPEGRVRLEWWKEGERHRYRLQAPEGYRVLVERPLPEGWSPARE